jgi:tetratricopeptide (TPR) repeat protein
MQRLIQHLLTGLLVLLLTHPLSAQDWKGKGRVQGQVLDPEDKPVQGANISLWFGGAEGVGPSPLVTDKKGRWSYLGLAGGSWTIHIVTESYMISEGTVMVREFGAPSPPIRITLKTPTVDPEIKRLADLLDRGNELLMVGNHSAARAAYEEVLPVVPESSRPSLLRALAQTWAGDGNSEKAIELLKESRALAPEDMLTLRLLINVLLEADRDDEAKPLIAILPSDQKLDLATRLNLGIDLFNKGEMEGAIEHFEKAIADYPEEADSYYYRAMVNMGNEKNAEAATDFEKYLSLAPADAPLVDDVKQFLGYVRGL